MSTSGLASFARFAILFFLASSSLAAEPVQDSCSTCHSEIGIDRLGQPVEDFRNDIHLAKGFRCVSCHGGDPTNPTIGAMEPARGYIGKPRPKEIARVCGRCHSDARFMGRYNPVLRVDQVTEYYTSAHGRRLEEFSDPKVATCVSCHTAHSIRSSRDPQSSVYPLRLGQTCGSCHADADYMEGYSIPTDQLSEYEQSIHWEALSTQGGLSAPTCNDCHGNHGATPPGVSSVSNVCGNCHVQNHALFEKSFHAKTFAQIGRPGCGSCHGDHGVAKVSDDMLGPGENSACGGCHTPESPGGMTATAMRRLLDQLRTAHDKARSILRQAEHAGMPVSQAQFELKAALTALIKARTVVHSFAISPVEKEVEAGLAISEKAYQAGVRALDDLDFRRKGLALSVLIIIALIVGLLIKIRQLEQRTSSDRKRRT